MNLDIVAGNWKQFKGAVQVQWGRLIGDYLCVITGRYTQLAGERQCAYSIILSKILKGTMGSRYSVSSFSFSTATVGNLPARAAVPTIHAHENH